MKTKLMTLQDATGFFRDGMTIMVGGFMGIGIPSRLVEALLESGVRDLTLIAMIPRLLIPASVRSSSMVESAK